MKITLYPLRPIPPFSKEKISKFVKIRCELSKSEGGRHFLDF
jgi:hypothetical protein